MTWPGEGVGGGIQTWEPQVVDQRGTRGGNDAGGRLWAVAGPKQSGKTYLTACLSYLLSTSTERAFPVDATLSAEPGRPDLNGQMLPVLGASATSSLGENTFEALSALRQIVVQRSQTLSPKRQSRQTAAVHLVLDLGPGTVSGNLGFHPFADDPILVTGVGRDFFVRSLMVLYRAVLEAWRLIFRDRPTALSFTEEIARGQSHRLYADLKSHLRQLASTDQSAADVAAAVLQSYRPGVIFNAVSEEDTGAAVEELRQLALHEVGVEVDYLGALPNEPKADRFLVDVRPYFVADSTAGAARWAARLLAAKVQALASKLEETHLVSEAAAPTPRQVPETLVCSDACDKWHLCEFRDPGFPCTIQYLQPQEYGVIRPIRLERLLTSYPSLDGGVPEGDPDAGTRGGLLRRFVRLFTHS